MAAAAGPATPQRPLPGAFLATPAQPGATIFASNAAALRQSQAPMQVDTSGSAAGQQSISPVERAARTINDTLVIEEKFPEMEAYVTQGISGEYSIPTNQAWLPFQKLKSYDLPPRLLEQINQSGMGMEMGVFPQIGHAWIALDNCLYLWDYTMPNPELIGYEENPHPITVVRLIAPKPGVFIADIKHMLVIGTAVDMQLLGVASKTTATGAQTIALYNTRMSIPTRGLGVHNVVASKETGRIFFVGNVTDDIFEFQYQQEEGWFRGKCSRICHTKTTLNFVSENMKAVGQYFGPAAKSQILQQLVIDDSRNLMYALSNTSEIRVFLVKDRLEQALTRPLAALLQNAGHFNSRTELLNGKDVRLCAISPITSAEALKVSLMATTSTGCRLYMSLTRGYGYQADAQNPPASMQILHIRYPPREAGVSQAPAQPGQTAVAPYSSSGNQVDATSKMLTPTTTAYRYSPGYFLAYQPSSESNGNKERIFACAPDSPRLKNPQDNSHLNSRFAEFGQWIDLPANFMQIAPISPDFAAASTPVGFGNELATQFDSPSYELAIVTTGGVQTLRRRRLVDMFAALLRFGSSDEEGVEGDIKRFVRTYGRGETAATAIAVACGQGLDVAESRVSSVTDSEVVEKARIAFIEHGGKPDYNANAVVDQGTTPIDSVRPSPRHEGLALYISRLVRSIWRAKVLTEKPKGPPGSKLLPTIKLEKLRSTQRDLLALKDFLERNKSFIEGLAGPQALGPAVNRQDEIAAQGEHRAMTGLVQIIERITEGISFVLALFEERIEEIFAILSDENKQRATELTFEKLFVSAPGRELAKDLVKAIVNRNIANGSNVDSVAETLRRKCGSFCSADDVVIFKAQEQVKRASEAGPLSDTGRGLLNESQRLFTKVAGSLTYDHLKWAKEMYVGMAFYAGSIQLCLTVAYEKDKSKRALSWLRDGKPQPDPRSSAFDTRKTFYDLIFSTIVELDKAAATPATNSDHQQDVAAMRKSEAYAIVNGSDDTIFLTCLYDWYIGTLNQSERLLETDNAFVVEYLRKQSQDSRGHGDLLWRYYAHHHNYQAAAAVQLDIAKSHFDLTLEDRIAYLSRARTNASARSSILSDSRQNQQRLQREISDLLDIATVQDELLQRFKEEPRLQDERRAAVLQELNGQILGIHELYNQYADQAGYHDICIQIYQVADYRNPADIVASWQQLINQTDLEAPAIHGRQALPYEAVGDKVMNLGRRLRLSNATFPVQALLPMAERYAIAPRQHPPPESWAVDLFLTLDVPHETLLPVLEQLYYGNEHPFTGSKRRVVAAHIVYLIAQWLAHSEKNGDRVVFGSDENASTVQDCLSSLVRGDLDAKWRREAEGLIARIAHALR